MDCKHVPRSRRFCVSAHRCALSRRISPTKSPPMIHTFVGPTQDQDSRWFGTFVSKILCARQFCEYNPITSSRTLFGVSGLLKTQLVILSIIRSYGAFAGHQLAWRTGQMMPFRILENPYPKNRSSFRIQCDSNATSQENLRAGIPAASRMLMRFTMRQWRQLFKNTF